MLETVIFAPGIYIRDSGIYIRDSGICIRDPGIYIRDPGIGIRDPGIYIRALDGMSFGLKKRIAMVARG
jgi:hypothetical protein